MEDLDFGMKLPATAGNWRTGKVFFPPSHPVRSGEGRQVWLFNGSGTESYGSRTIRRIRKSGERWAFDGEDLGPGWVVEVRPGVNVLPRLTSEIPDPDGVVSQPWRSSIRYLSPGGERFVRVGRRASASRSSRPANALQANASDGNRDGRIVHLKELRLSEEQADDGYEVMTDAQVIAAQRREKQLLARYRTAVRRTFVSYSIRPPGAAGTIYVDAFDKKRKLLIEAKAAPDRDKIRMAIGQLKDYARFFEPRPNLAVLLPKRPVKDLQDLLAQEGIHGIWIGTNGQFTDTAGGRFT